MTGKKVIVIGAGPAGLMAAGQAALSGAKVYLLEKMNRPALKLRITGKGRCNMTNITGIQDFISHFGKNGKFLLQAFSVFFNNDLIEFFNQQGIATTIERGGRIFPESNEAEDIANALIKWNNNLGVDIITSSPVDELIIKNDIIIGVTIKGTNSVSNTIKADAVIIATGGASYPGTGSTGNGYQLGKEAGHSVINIRPALIPLNTKGDIAKKIEGLSLKNINASIWMDNKKTSEEFGEMLFTKHGVSGPVILTLSKICVDALQNKNKVNLSIDLKPALEHKVLDQRLIHDIKKSPNKTVKNLLKGLLPESLIPICLEITEIQGDKKSNQITSTERKKLKVWLKDFRLEITGHRPLSEAIITAGGINVKEINPRSMESYIVKGLYFAGEVIDIDADTGGYNLQAAFSTGWLAGHSAAASSVKSAPKH